MDTALVLTGWAILIVIGGPLALYVEECLGKNWF